MFQKFLKSPQKYPRVLQSNDPYMSKVSQNSSKYPKEPQSTPKYHQITPKYPKVP